MNFDPLLLLSPKPRDTKFTCAFRFPPYQVLGAFGEIWGAFFGHFVACAAFQKTLKNLQFSQVFDVLGVVGGLLEASWKLFWAMLARS